MERNELDIYINIILKKQLQKLKISNHGLYSIMNNVSNQLSSIIKHWHDKEFIDAIFTTVIEEGHFYEPHVNDKLGNLVVLGIRNSLLEIAASINYKEYGLKQDLCVEDIKNITSEAIKYFKDIDMDSLSNKMNIDNDYYYDIVQKYKVAYSALVELSKLSDDKLENEFNIIKEKPYILDEIIECDEKVDLNSKIEDISNGIDTKLPLGLVKLLKGILNREASLFYVDSFKYLSRNFETNLRVLEFLLTHDSMFLTNNFLIKNGYVSRRKNLIRASHQKDFNINGIETIGEVSKKYKDDIEKIFQQK